MKKLNLPFVKKRRVELKLTLANMADNFGFKSPSTYLKYENGDYAFRAEHLPLLAQLLKCNVEDLFFDNIIAKSATKNIGIRW